MCVFRNTSEIHFPQFRKTNVSLWSGLILYFYDLLHCETIVVLFGNHKKLNVLLTYMETGKFVSEHIMKLVMCL